MFDLEGKCIHVHWVLWLKTIQFQNYLLFELTDPNDPHTTKSEFCDMPVIPHPKAYIGAHSVN